MRRMAALVLMRMALLPLLAVRMGGVDDAVGDVVDDGNEAGVTCA